MSKKLFFYIWGCAASLFLAFGCAASSKTEAMGGAAYPGGNGQGAMFDGGMSAGGGAGGSYWGGMGGTGGAAVLDGRGASADAGIPPLPAEQQYQASFELPQAGKNFVFVTNPESNNVAVIDAANLSIQTVSTGANPRFLQTVAGTDTAIALNVDSANASIIRVNEEGVVSRKNVDVIQGANAVAVAPDGKHAIVYVNSQYIPSGKSSGSYQKITVITLSDQGDKKLDLTVAYKPQNIFFSSDSAKAFVVAEQDISILDFASIDSQGAGMRTDVSLGYAFGDIPSDVSVTPDGRYALARLENASVLHLVDLAAADSGKAVKVLDLAGLVANDKSGEDAGKPQVSVTDLDLSEDGSFAVAVVREKSAVLRIPVPAAFDDPSIIDTIKLAGLAIIGSAFIAPDNLHVLLYTTTTTDIMGVPLDASRINHVTILDLSRGAKSQKTIRLHRSVKAVVVTPDSENALIIHQPQPDAGSAVPGQTFEGPYGYTMLKLSTGAATLQTTWADVGTFALVPEGKCIFLLFRNDSSGIREAHRVSLDTFVADTIGLESPPTSVGSVPRANKVFIGQEHAGGWITFIDLDTNEKQSVTGFELNSNIWE